MIFTLFEIIRILLKLKAQAISRKAPFMDFLAQHH